ncbi:MAG: SRPBCC domain-containing protein, partial [Myxococcales bacterium]|nr:SRPBCC domain-containing protein [Myxococcales bacterium]
MAAARAWYAEVLGFEPYFDEPFYVGFEVGGYELGLTPREDESRQGAGGDTPYWAVEDVQSAVDRLVSLGAVVAEEPKNVGGEIIVGAVVDPFGNVLGLIRNPDFAPPMVAVGTGDALRAPLIKTATVSADPGEVWRLWTTSEGMAEWWVPKNRIECRVGGHYELYFMQDAPLGSQGSEGCRVLAFLPERMLSFTWNAPPHLSRTRRRFT